MSTSDLDEGHAIGGDVEYDSQMNTYRAEYDWSRVKPSTAVVELVASINDEDPTDLEPLYEYVDPDALDTLFDSERASSTSRFTFEFGSNTTTVHGDGTVAVYRRGR